MSAGMGWRHALRAVCRGWMRLGFAGLTALMGLPGLAMAQGREPTPEELAALNLADLAPQAQEQAAQARQPWQGYWELAWGQASERGRPEAQSQGRASMRLQADVRSSAEMRWVGVLRLDHSEPAQQPYPPSLLSLQEAYVSWQPSESLALDLGRINARQGLGTGYNPSDFLRAGALRSQIAVDPASIKNNRLGTVMLRAQGLWAGGALSAMLAPKLAQQASSSGWSADLGATNDRSRYLISLSQRWTENLQPQWLLFGADGQSPQLGMNLSSLWGPSTLVYGEWAGGQRRMQIEQALALPQAAQSWQNQWAMGLRSTAENKLSLTLEWAYDGAAPDQQAWQQLQAQGGAYWAYRQWVQRAQALNTRSQWGLYLNWPDLPGWPQLDLNAMLRHNPQDHSQLAWLELRRRWPGLDVALQWQRHWGRAGSEYGSLPQVSAWQLSLRGYF